MTDEEKDEQFYRDTESIAFPKLNDTQLALLEKVGTRRLLRKGEPVFVAGQRDMPMTVVLSGEIEVFDLRDGQEMILATHGPRDFVGDVAMLNGTSAISSGRGKADVSEILEIPAVALRQALAELPGVGEPVTQAFIMRRKRLQRDKQFAGMRIVAEESCREAQRIHDFLDKNHFPHRLVDIESPDGQALRNRYQAAREALPVLIDNDGTAHVRPTLREVALLAGLLRPVTGEGVRKTYCDLAVVGAGPSGLSAALNAASEGLETIVLESYAPGGQAASSSLIENFFGFPTGISGGELTNRAQLQAYRFGAKFSNPAQVLSLKFVEGEHPFALTVENCPAVVYAKSVLIATGANYRRLEAEGRERFEGVGVYYAATAMEAGNCRNATVIVAGAGNSAGQAAMYLSETAAKVILVVRGNDLSKSMSTYLSRRVEHTENIEICYSTEVRRMSGGDRLESVEIENTEIQERRVIHTPAVFSMIGAKPCTDWVPKEIERDEKEFIKTGRAVAESAQWKTQIRGPELMETSYPGVFASGDVRCGSVKRCAAAVGEGGMAVEGIHRLLGTYS